MRCEKNETTGERPDDRRAPWVTPVLKRLDAGAAEQGLAGVNDFAMNPS